jgi:hypothetical protein
MTLLDKIVSSLGLLASLAAAVFWLWASLLKVPDDIDTFVQELQRVGGLNAIAAGSACFAAICAAGNFLFRGIASSMAGGEGRSGHTSPLAGEAVLHGWRSRAIADKTDQRVPCGRPGSSGRPYARCFNDGGGMLADPSTSRPVQVLIALRPASSAVADQANNAFNLSPMPFGLLSVSRNSPD